MKFIKNIRGFFYKTDFFHTTQLLRYKDQPEYRTLFGGVLSLIIIIGLIATFYNKFVDTLDKVIISSVSDNINAADPTPFTISTFNQDNFMFGVEIWHHDLNTGDRYFDVVLTSAQFDTGQRRASSIEYPLQPCQRSHWQGFPEVQSQFDRLYMNYWLCLPKNSTYNIQGKYASVFSQTLEVAVKKCTNSSKFSRPCADQATIDQYFVDNAPFFFTIYFINPLINPTSQNYLSYYLQDNNYIIFNQQFGSQGVLFMEQFSIDTDESILPFNEIQTKNGGVVNQFALKNPYTLTSNSQIYCSFSFFKSGLTRDYTRTFQKIDQVLSYIGGLFGTIAILLFIVNIYNTHCFQIAIGAHLFQPPNQKKQSNLKGYNFFSFLAHLVYIFFNFFYCPPNWQKIKKYDICRQQMKKQLDIRYLVKRIFFLEKTLKFIFQDYQLKGLHLLYNLDLNQAKLGRKCFKLKKKFIKSKAKLFSKRQKPSNESIGQNSTYIIQTKFDQNLNQIKSGSSDIQQQNNKQTNWLQKNLKLPKVNLSDLHLFQSDDSSSSSQQQTSNNQFQTQLIKLKIDSQNGNPLSNKIWQNIDEQIKRNIQKKFQTAAQDNKQLTNNVQSIRDFPPLKKLKQKRNRFSSPIIVNDYIYDQPYQNNNNKQKNSLQLIQNNNTNNNEIQLINKNNNTTGNKLKFDDNSLIFQDSKANVMIVNSFDEQSSPNIISYN